MQNPNMFHEWDLFENESGWKLAKLEDLQSLIESKKYRLIEEKNDKPTYDDVIKVLTWKDGEPRCTSGEIWKLEIAGNRLMLSDGCGDINEVVNGECLIDSGSYFMRILVKE